jgi:hypothetical protein
MSMRYAALFLTAFCFAVPVGSSAATLQPPGIEAVQNPSIVTVAGRCGRHYHYVRGHRNRYGRWVRGRCVPNRR